MQTAIEIEDELLLRVRREARREHKTLGEIVEEALKQWLTTRMPRRTFRLKRHAFKGEGLQRGVTEGDWATMRDLISRRNL